jgi:hypothetical protein
MFWLVPWDKEDPRRPSCLNHELNPRQSTNESLKYFQVPEDFERLALQWSFPDGNKNMTKPSDDWPKYPKKQKTKKRQPMYQNQVRQ